MEPEKSILGLFCLYLSRVEVWYYLIKTRRQVKNISGWGALLFCCIIKVSHLSCLASGQLQRYLSFPSMEIDAKWSILSLMALTGIRQLVDLRTARLCSRRLLLSVFRHWNRTRLERMEKKY